MSQGPTRTRSLWPREHGAYVQLGAPLVASLAATAPTLASAAIAVGACLAFVASEPLRIVLGDRGKRQRELAGDRARARLAWLGSAAVAAGGTGLLLAPRSALVVAALVGLPIALVVALSRRRAVKTIFGETVAAAALAGASAPVAIAGGMPVSDAVGIWCAWSLGYATTVIAVHHVIDHHRHAGIDVPRMLLLAGLWAALVLLGRYQPTAWAMTPLAALAALVLLRPPRATHLRAIGVAFLVCSLAAAAGIATMVRQEGPSSDAAALATRR